MVDDRTVKREDSLNTDSEACFPHRNRLSGTPVFASNDYTFERLQALLCL